MKKWLLLTLIAAAVAALVVNGCTASYRTARGRLEDRRARVQSLVRANGTVTAEDLRKLFGAEAPLRKPWMEAFAVDVYSDRPASSHKHFSLNDVPDLFGRNVPSAEASFDRDGKLVRIAYSVWSIDGF